MTILYVSSSSNKLKVVEMDDETGNLVRIIQTVDPIVDPLPSPHEGGESLTLPTSGPFQPVTEWILKHPQYNLVYALTSFWSTTSSMVTTFRIVDAVSGKLQKLGQTETGGLQAAHATFFVSPENKTTTTLCIAHHNDGTVSLFDCSEDDALPTLPIQRLSTPLVVPGTRTTKFPRCVPSIHHVSYSPDGKYLLTSDSSTQGRVWTYAVDPSNGVPLQDTPTSSLKVTFVSPTAGWFGYLFTKLMMGSKFRIRRAVIHPNNNGRYVYLVMEFNAVLQVYKRDPVTGKIYGDCLQEVPTVDPAYFGRGGGNDRSASSKWTGIALNAASELYVTDTEVLVSNRGFKIARLLGSAESSIHIFSIQKEGAKLAPKQMLQCAGPVRHFWMNDNATKLYAGVNMGQPEVVETFVRRSHDGAFEKVGQANVEMDVLCIAAKE